MLASTMMQQALPLGGDDHTDPHYLREVQARTARGEPPLSAEEYLLRVRLEFAALPEVMEATHIDPRAYDSHQTAYMPSQPSLPPTPAGLAPSLEWEEDVLANFYEVRESLTTLEEEVGVGKDRNVKVPPLREEGSWRVFFFGRKGRGEGGEGAGRGRKRKKAGGEEVEKEEAVMEGEREEEGEMAQKKDEKGELSDSPPMTTTTAASEREGEEGGIDAAVPAATAPPAAPSQPHHPSLPPALAALVSPPPPSLPALPRPAAAVAVAAPAVVYEGPTPPLTSLVLQFDQVCTLRLLGYHAQWLDSSSSLKHAQGAWLFALLARLSQPLHPEAAALVRQIYRRCYLLRAHFVLPPPPPPPPAAAAEEEEEEEEEEGEGPVAVLARLNTLIAITGTFFEQAEGGQEEEEGEEGEVEEEDVMEVEEAEEEEEGLEQQEEQQQQQEERMEKKREEEEEEEGEGQKERQAEEEEKEEGEVEEEGEIR